MSKYNKSMIANDNPGYFQIAYDRLSKTIIDIYVLLYLISSFYADRIKLINV